MTKKDGLNQKGGEVEKNFRVAVKVALSKI